MGTGCKDGSQTALIPQVMNALFCKIETMKNQAEFQLRVSFIEVQKFCWLLPLQPCLKLIPTVFNFLFLIRLCWYWWDIMHLCWCCANALSYESCERWVGIGCTKYIAAITLLLLLLHMPIIAYFYGILYFTYYMALFLYSCFCFLPPSSPRWKIQMERNRIVVYLLNSFSLKPEATRTILLL